MGFITKSDKTKCPSSLFFQIAQMALHTFILPTPLPSQMILLYIYEYCDIFNISSLVFHVQYIFFSLHMPRWFSIVWMAILLLQVFLKREKMERCQNTVCACVTTVRYSWYAEGLLQFLYLLYVLT